MESAEDFNTSYGMTMEVRTVEAMIRIYCRAKHGSTEKLCSECYELLDYAKLRISKCPFGDKKPTCENCTIHCYRPEPREQIKQVMRFSGPRMLMRHPVLAIRHLIRGKRYSGTLSK